MSIPSPKFAFFGSSRFSVLVLEELARAGLVPAVVVTTSDKPAGRKLALTATPVKEWAEAKKIKVFAPEKLDDAFAEKLTAESCQVFIVASYGKMIPPAIIDLPPRHTLNIHPSLLPKYRGAAPLQSAMLADDKGTGVTIIRLDEKMDHGPIIAQEQVSIEQWPTYEEFEEMMAKVGAQLLARSLPNWLSGTLKEQEQDHSAATYTKKISKEDGLIDYEVIANTADPDTADRQYLTFRKIQAFHEWPQAYFFIEHNGRKIRVKITAASFVNGRLEIKTVIPEGSKEMPYKDFLTGYR